jgi:hypothetical protein
MCQGILGNSVISLLEIFGGKMMVRPAFLLISAILPNRNSMSIDCSPNFLSVPTHASQES